MIRILFLAMIVLAGLQACSNREKANYDPTKYMSANEQKRVKEEIIRYVAKSPRRVTGDIKFDTIYDEHYARQLESTELLAYHISSSGERFFMVCKIAPSMEKKWVAIAGRMRFDENNVLVAYEEVFRTWKLPRPLLEERALYLFALLVKGEDLSPYYAVNAGFNYIEFPDENVYYDKQVREWKSKIYGSVEEIVYESRDADSLSKKPRN